MGWKVRKFVSQEISKLGSHWSRYYLLCCVLILMKGLKIYYTSSSYTFLIYEVTHKSWRVSELLKNVGFEVLTMVVVKSTIFWDITPCSPLNVNRHFGGTYRLHLQGRKQIQQEISVMEAICSSESSVDTLTDYAALYPRRWYSCWRMLQTHRVLGSVSSRDIYWLIMKIMAYILNPSTLMTWGYC
jgi:hypothetical protein